MLGAPHVVVDSSGIDKVAETIDEIPKVNWDFEGIHYFDNGPLTVQYLFVLDALNFCFCPDKDLNCDDLASGLKEALLKDKSAFDAGRLHKYTGPELRELLKWPRTLPLEDERVRLLHEVGFELERSFDGKASNLVESCGNSAVKLVAMVTRNFLASETTQYTKATKYFCINELRYLLQIYGVHLVAKGMESFMTLVQSLLWPTISCASAAWCVQI